MVGKLKSSRLSYTLVFKVPCHVRGKGQDRKLS